MTQQRPLNPVLYKFTITNTFKYKLFSLVLYGTFLGQNFKISVRGSQSDINLTLSVANSLKPFKRLSLGSLRQKWGLTHPLPLERYPASTLGPNSVVLMNKLSL